MFDIIHFPGILIGQNGHQNCEDKYIFILTELSSLIGFGYDLSDTQDGLKSWRMGFMVCGEHPLFLTKNQMSNSGPIGPPVCFVSKID